MIGKKMRRKGSRGRGRKGGERGRERRERGRDKRGKREGREEKYLAHFGLLLPQSAQNSLPEMEYSSLEIFTRLLGFLRNRHSLN